MSQLEFRIEAKSVPVIDQCLAHTSLNQDAHSSSDVRDCGPYLPGPSFFSFMSVSEASRETKAP